MSDVEPRENPYRLSKAAARGRNDGTPHRSLGVLIVASFEAMVGALSGLLAPGLIGNFEELFKGFGADLSPLTRFVLASRHAWLLFAFAAIAILVWIVKRPATNQKEKSRQKVVVITFGLLFALAWGIATVALYLPIFELGAAV